MKGMWREVYEHPTDSRFVIKKLAPNPDHIKRLLRYKKDIHNPNLVEWKVWNMFKEDPLSDVLCPCVELSPCERYLIMVRCEPVRYIPTIKLPKMFKDVQNRNNWAILNNREVFLDYGNCVI